MNSQERHEARYQRRKAKRQEKRRLAMQEYDNFDKVFTFEHLWKCYKKCMCGVAWKTSTQKYRNKPITNLSNAYIRLHKGTYKSKGFYSFTIIERGKTRNIKSVHISERIVQRCLCDYSLIPALTPSLIYDNGACMKGKGIDFAKDRMTCHLQRYYRKHKTNKGYALAIDFSSYFDRILHDRLEIIIRAKYFDERIIRLYMHFVDMFGEVGLGLGSQISQISAICYPSAIDHSVKSDLHIKEYGRYMDDSNLINESKQYLHFCKNQIESLCEKYGIVLNRKKTQIVKLSRGVPYLKQRFVLTDKGDVLRLPKEDNTRRMCRKLKSFARWLETGKMKPEDARTSYYSWRSHLIRSNAFFKLQNMDKRFRTIMKNYKEKNSNGSN